MTPEERAWKLGVFLELDRNRGVIADAIRAAIEEEREACVKAIEAEFDRRGLQGSSVAIAAIRARDEK